MQPHPAPEAQEPPHRAAFRAGSALFDRHVTARPPPATPAEQVVYGLVQPLLGLRVLAGDRKLVRAALLPVAVLAGFCAVVAVLSAGERHGAVHRFYTTFAVLAPLPSVIFAHHYARFAVAARHKLGFSPAEPYLESLWRTLKRAFEQSLLIAIALAPVSFVLRLVPGTGWALVQIAAAIWALHWIVVDAFDSARVLRPGETIAEADAQAGTLPAPWYVRWLHHGADRVPIAGRLVHRFARLCDRLSMSLREEIVLVERHPAVMLGFALATAALLAIPVLNLAFRPVIIIGAAHVIGQLEDR
jgi:hypothetical protein